MVEGLSTLRCAPAMYMLKRCLLLLFHYASYSNLIHLNVFSG